MKQRIIKVIILDSAIAMVLGILVFVKYKFGIGIPCALNLVTGISCPGCGNTRSFIALLHGDIYQAIRYNALFLLLAPFFLVYFTIKTKSYIIGRKKDLTDRIPLVVYILLIIITILFGIIRNISYFKYLLPTIIN